MNPPNRDQCTIAQPLDVRLVANASQNSSLEGGSGFPVPVDVVAFSSGKDDTKVEQSSGSRNFNKHQVGQQPSLSISGGLFSEDLRSDSCSALPRLWHAHLDPLDQGAPKQDCNKQDKQAWDSFRHLQKTVLLLLKTPDSSPHHHQPYQHRLRVVPWFHPSLLPSPTAFYFWRQENANTFKLVLGLPAEVLFFKYLVSLNYERALHERIIRDQDMYEALLARQASNFKPLFEQASLLPSPPPSSVFTGVAEAEMDGTAPCDAILPHLPDEAAWLRASHAGRNRKAFSIDLYVKRSRFQDEWNYCCRLGGSNDQNHLFDFAHFASHNPYSMYHKIKFGEWGSPYPYVPFAITNPLESVKSRREQVQQELDAVRWIHERRSVAETQDHLNQIGAMLRRQQAAAMRPDQHSAAQTPVNSTTCISKGGVVAVAVPDDVMVDQEVEQPETMGCLPSAQGQSEPCASLHEAPITTSWGDAGLTAGTGGDGAILALPPKLTKSEVSLATSITNPITVSVIVPENLMPWIRREIYQQLKRDHPRQLKYWLDNKTRRLPWPKKGRESEGNLVRLKPVVNVAAVVTDDELPWRAGDSFPLRYDGDESWAQARDLSGCDSGPRWSRRSVSEEPPPSFRLGNLFLSSCPGKKVRLNGPVRGRGAVCRDLGLDLRRFQELGVGTVVCCLSDSELNTAGVRSEEYLQEADRLGLDLIFIPIVEGNSPTFLDLLDAWLNEIVVNCTLKGINVLVHCRGGVGRAGLIAACWLVKMGFVDEYRPAAERVERGNTWPSQEILWQCLQIVRLRRSAKAIETAEQAAFIASYGQYVLDQWVRHYPDVEPLEARHCQMVDDYWQRMRKETEIWMKRQARATAKPNGEQSEGGGGWPAHARALERNRYRSNINSRHAAHVKQAGVAGDGDMESLSSDKASPRVLGVNGKDDQGGDLVTSSGSHTSSSSGTFSEKPLGRGDGEPRRKRRSTLSTMAAIRLSDVEDTTQESQSVGGGSLPEGQSVASASAKVKPGCVSLSLSSHMDDEECDAFPVAGRSDCISATLIPRLSAPLK